MTVPCLCGDLYCGSCHPGTPPDTEICVRCRASLYLTEEDDEPMEPDLYPWCSEECRDIDAAEERDGD